MAGIAPLVRTDCNTLLLHATAVLLSPRLTPPAARRVSIPPAILFAVIRVGVGTISNINLLLKKHFDQPRSYNKTNSHKVPVSNPNTQQQTNSSSTGTRYRYYCCTRTQGSPPGGA